MAVIIRGSTALVLGFVLLGGTAQAQEAAPVGAIDVVTTIGGVSDYRFRGVSLSGEEPAVQGSIELDHRSGLYAGAWASTLGDAGPDGEVDIYGGWSKSLGLTTVDVGVLGYLFLDGSDRNRVELYGSLGWELGPATATFGVNYAPDQKNVGGTDNLYLYGNLGAGIPNTPVTLRAHLGYEDGGLVRSGGDKLDWSIGADYRLGRFTLGAAYVDTDVRGLDAADPTIVLSLAASF